MEAGAHKQKSALQDPCVLSLFFPVAGSNNRWMANPVTTWCWNTGNFQSKALNSRRASIMWTKDLLVDRMKSSFTASTQTAPIRWRGNNGLPGVKNSTCFRINHGKELTSQSAAHKSLHPRASPNNYLNGLLTIVGGPHRPVLDGILRSCFNKPNGRVSNTTKKLPRWHGREDLSNRQMLH